MANVTDAAFRRVISEIAKPAVMWTEFVSCEALTHDTDSRRRMMTTLKYAEQERPVVAQLFGSKPDQFYEVYIFWIRIVEVVILTVCSRCRY
ncbi:hypothetical protein CCR75_003531 [Bremia lactucae]|uniref:DUS-like FMN-binding domain-containing protein n=1 Tax=Bremia lactucae TaxID=4779 RepID=A0A976IHB5_BRELC|nr:hypothetical protein CCR75_003531 [Bremia lactucae]